MKHFWSQIVPGHKLKHYVVTNRAAVTNWSESQIVPSQYIHNTYIIYKLQERYRTCICLHLLLYMPYYFISLIIKKGFYIHLTLMTYCISNHYMFLIYVYIYIYFRWPIVCLWRRSTSCYWNTDYVEIVLTEGVHRIAKSMKVVVHVIVPFLKKIPRLKMVHVVIGASKYIFWTFLLNHMIKCK